MDGVGIEDPAVGTSGRAWSFLVVGDDRDFQGNSGYDDVVEESYSYDSTVGNHRRVARGDLVVVRDSREALGVGYIEELEVFPNQSKLRSRCPNCGSTSFKERTTELVRYWCSPCKSAFDLPKVENIEVTGYRAHYGGSWQALEGCLDKGRLAELSLSNSDQQSIKAMDYRELMAALIIRGVRLPGEGWEGLPGRRNSRVLPGGRRRTTAAARRGQDAFRRALLGQYGAVCAVTGPAPAEVLEAAHLRPFATTEQHRVEEGLILRADIHRLLDNGLLTVSPELVVSVAPCLRGYPDYSALHGTRLLIPEDAVLDRMVLHEHFVATTASW
ncbi:HNH endonuclease [Streptacidiphilus pinicola]|uniref:HNH endonuclease n=1 Tax=Streptacidiphilus pinicola TaxID=2219663 RepID=A0A2X0K8H8_9ACTN|nr:HNH endonuclease signature motif containing protein [Streptacidiphilus pinicola]RAG83819.1 HNH endonuclease [Streptacidiphilus pinicola]